MNPTSVGGGRYVLGELLGGGGTSAVYAARDQLTQTDVAVKQLRPQFASDLNVRRRFLGEAAAMRRLQHPGVVRLLDVVDDPGPFLVMERMRGPTLRAWRDAEPQVSPQTALLIVRRLAEALSVAHAHGIIHRDLKPQNIFVCAPIGGPGESQASEGDPSSDDPVPIGAIRIADFGNARVAASASLTGSSTTWGSPEYMAPEVFARGRLDPRADLYSLGLILFELLMGRPPFSQAQTLAQLTRVGDRARQDLPATGAGPLIDALIADLVAPRPCDRPPTAGALLARLRDALTPLPPTTVAEETETAPEPPPLPRPCAACATPYRLDLPRCPRCGHTPLLLQHAQGAPFRVVLTHVADDAKLTARLAEAIERLTDRPLEVAILSRAQELYSEDDLRNGLALPAVLFSELDGPTANAIAGTLAAPGITVEVQRGENTRTRAKRFLPRSLGAGVGTTIGSLILTHEVLHTSEAVGRAVAATTVVLTILASHLWFGPKPKAIYPRFSLRPHAAPLPVADRLLGRLIEASQRLRAEEPRALVHDLAAEVYRLARGAVAQARATSGIAQRLLGELPGLVDHLVSLATRADALDAALDQGSERALVAELVRLDRQLRDARPAEVALLTATRAEVEAALEQRSKTERDREHVVAELCRLLADLRDLVRRVGALETTPPEAQHAVALEAMHALERLGPRQEA